MNFPRRGQIARSIHNIHQQLRKTPKDKLCGGNITSSLTKDVLKMISSEVQKSMRLHNVLLEQMLTQKMMECSDNVSSGGHIQYLQVDPFGVVK